MVLDVVQRGGSQARLLAGAPRAVPGRTPAWSSAAADEERDVVAHGSKVVLGARRTRGRLRRSRHEPDLHHAGAVHPAQGCGSRHHGRRLWRRLPDLLGDDTDRLDQVRRPPDAGPQPRRRRRHGARGADSAPWHRSHRGAGHARDLRRRSVLRRRHDHAGDLGDVRCRGTQGRRPRPGAPHRPDFPGNPDRSVRGAAERHRRGWLAVRSADPRVVRRDRAARRCAR